MKADWPIQPSCIKMLPDVGMAKIVSKVSWSQQLVTWVVRSVTEHLILVPRLDFFRLLGIAPSLHLYLPFFVENAVAILVYVLFMERKLVCNQLPPSPHTHSECLQTLWRHEGEALSSVVGVTGFSALPLSRLYFKQQRFLPLSWLPLADSFSWVHDLKNIKTQSDIPPDAVRYIARYPSQICFQSTTIHWLHGVDWLQNRGDSSLVMNVGLLVLKGVNASESSFPHCTCIMSHFSFA